jgi:hypothetical protein
VVGGYDLGGNAAPPLRTTRPVGQRRSDEGKSRTLGPGFLDGSASQRQPLPRPGLCRGLGWQVSFEAHPGSGDSVTRPAVHVIQDIRRAEGVPAAALTARYGAGVIVQSQNPPAAVS